MKVMININAERRIIRTIIIFLIPCVCNDYHDLLQKAMSFKEVAIVSVKRRSYKFIFWVYERI